MPPILTARAVDDPNREAEEAGLAFVNNHPHSPLVCYHRDMLCQLLPRLGMVADAVVKLGVLLPGKIAWECDRNCAVAVKRLRVVLPYRKARFL